MQKFTLEHVTPFSRGSRPQNSLFPHSIETCFTTGASAVSNSFGPPSPLSEPWESSNEEHLSFTHHCVSNRQSFISKPIYPLVYQNPVSDSEVCGSGNTTNHIRLSPSNDTTCMWREGSSIVDLKFHNTLTELQKMEASPDSSRNSRREGFRLSNGSSYDLGFIRESIDVTDQIDLENVKLPCDHTDVQNCGLCGRSLLQKSPWSSSQIVRSSDMPIAGVLRCSHTFHAECLEQTTPKTQSHDPPCPICQKSDTELDTASPISEPQVLISTVQRNQGIEIADDSSNQSLDQMDGRMKRNWSSQITRRGGNSAIKNHFKKHLSFKGKIGKDLFSAKAFHSNGSSSSDPHDNENQVGCLRIGQSSRK